MFRKAIIVTALVAGAVGFVAGNSFWYLASPLWIDRTVSEPLTGGGLQAGAKGAFKDGDASHAGKGTVTLFNDPSGQRLLRFTDFEVTNGPDLKVYVVDKADVASAEDVTGNTFRSLGALKGNIGDQNYALPKDLEFTPRSVVIWCEQFGVLFSAATLN